MSSVSIFSVPSSSKSFSKLSSKLSGSSFPVSKAGFSSISCLFVLQKLELAIESFSLIESAEEIAFGKA